MDNSLLKPNSRSVAIDAFRAAVMVLMIFVNDYLSLSDIPAGLLHAPASADGMGLADIVFPAFLFIVGLSLPYAIQSREKKGDTKPQVWLHILYRTIALITMGFFLVNGETYLSSGAVLDQHLWLFLLVISFFLIWLDYPSMQSATAKILKGSGILLLIALALVYHSDAGSGITALRPQWWGILGKIGWAYFIVSNIYLLSRQKFWWQVTAFIFLLWFCSANHLGWLKPILFLKDYIWIAANGAPSAMAMAGLITSLIYRKYGTAQKKFWIALFTFALIALVFGFLTRPLWGISKIRATPSWVSICTGISISGFLLVVFVTDVKKITGWYNFIKPAGAFTLTCYLIPDLHFALVKITHMMPLPLFLRTGSIGLCKSFLYALLIVYITGLLAKKHIRLKI